MRIKTKKAMKILSCNKVTQIKRGQQERQDMRNKRIITRPKHKLPQEARNMTKLSKIMTRRNKFTETFRIIIVETK